MKKLLFCIVLLAGASSCNVRRNTIIPKAVNTINTVALGDLNLARGDYEILNTVTAEATVAYQANNAGTSIRITGEEDEFSLHYTQSKGVWRCKYHGILKFGYLHNDYEGVVSDLVQPEEIARRLAIYRIINMAQEYGADGFVEPTVATNIQQVGKDVYFKSVVTAKIIKLKTDR